VREIAIDCGVRTDSRFAEGFVWERPSSLLVVGELFSVSAAPYPDRRFFVRDAAIVRGEKMDTRACAGFLEGEPSVPSTEEAAAASGGWGT